MTRRRLVALVSAAVLVALGLVALAAVLFVTRTNAGREKLREIARPLAARVVKSGTLYIGHLSGNIISGVTIDSIAIRDKRGDLFLATGPLTLTWNPRDLADNRLLFRHAQVEHPYVHLVQHENGEWNFKEIFGSNDNQPQKPKELNTRNFGDYVVIDSAVVHDGAVLVTMPWHPDEALRGTARDSAIKAHLASSTKVYTQTYDGYGRTYAWRRATGLVTHARLADPDSDKFGQEFQLARVSVDEYEPTFKIRNLTGEMRHLGDSIWFQAPHFDMPASTGRGQGKVWWGSDKPVRLDIAVRGDSVSLDDINWVYPMLPRTGGGTVDLAIQNDPKNLQVIDFNLQNMDVRSTKSHLTGQMAFGTGAPVLLVRRVDLRADPVDFDLLRTLNGKPFPEDWQGQLIGTLKGRGGPLTNFLVDDAQVTFADAHVRGATSRFAGRGELDILNMAYTEFHHFDVDAKTIDLRSIEYLFPAFPRLGGFASGTATLDSSWLDVRFYNANIIHQDGPGEPTHATGNGRITYGEPYMTYDLALNAEPLSLTMLSRSYPLHLTGTMSGPISVKGTSADLDVTASLQGAAGAFSFNGRVDADSVGGYGVHGRGDFSGLALASLLDKSAIPTGPLSGHYDADLIGASASTLRGTANVSLEPTTLKGVRVYQSTARVRFADGQMSVDSLRVHTKAATLVAKSAGGIGLPHGRADSLAFTIEIDSLGGLRPLLIPDTTGAATAASSALAAMQDSLTGTLQVHGMLRGTLDSLSVSGTLAGDALNYRGELADAVSATFNFRNVFTAPAGTIDVRVDTALLAGIAIDALNGRFIVVDSSHRTFSVGATNRSGLAAGAAGSWTSAPGVESVLVDSLGLQIGASRWRLARPVHLAVDDAGSRLDSLLLRNADSASLMLTESVPRTGPAFAQLRAAHVPLRDVGQLFGVRDTIAGTADLAVSATGTKAKPVIVADALLSSVRWSGMDLDHATGSAHYENGRLQANADAVHAGSSGLAAKAVLPADISLFSVNWRRNDPISATLKADSTDLSILQPLFPSVRAKGWLAANLDVSGTLASPLYAGTLSVRNGYARVDQLGAEFNNITADVKGDVSASGRDSVSVGFAASSAGDRAGRVTGAGWVKNVMQPKTPMAFRLAVVLDSLHAYSRRTVADLYLTTPYINLRTRQRDTLKLSGTTSASTLSGSLSVDHSSIYLLDADLARKQVVEALTDSGDVSFANGAPATFAKFRTGLAIPSVTVTLGEDVRLRSAEADVRLGGQLLLTEARGTPTPTLAGQLTTLGGTYNLNLQLVQREFEVLSDGTVTFDGSTDNPMLDIKALYNVKQFHDRDLGVIVKLQGRLKNPKIQFASDADYTISQSDLVSYLVLGKPGLDFGANSDARDVLASVLAPTLSAFAADRLRQGLGSWADMIQFQLGSGSFSTGTSASQSSYSSFLYGATIGAGRQLTSDLYLSVNTGLCQLDANFQGSRSALTGVGAKAEYRFKPNLSLQLAYDPPTANRTCNDAQQSIVGLVPTPLNFSLAFSHTWRF